MTAPCQQVTANRYPFAKSDRDVPMADFARMFAPGGVIDRFFSTNLAPLVNLSSKTWTWRPNPNLTRKLSDTTLRQFQQAAEIRDAFFPTGGNQPTINLEVKPLTLSGEAQTATLLINGASVVAQQGANAPSTVQWPGAGAGRRLDRAAAGNARPHVQAGALRRLGVVPAARRRLGAAARQRGQREFRGRRARSVLSIQPPPR